MILRNSNEELKASQSPFLGIEMGVANPIPQTFLGLDSICRQVCQSKKQNWISLEWRWLITRGKVFDKNLLSIAQ